MRWVPHPREGIALAPRLALGGVGGDRSGEVVLPQSRSIRPTRAAERRVPIRVTGLEAWPRAPGYCLRRCRRCDGCSARIRGQSRRRFTRVRKASEGPFIPGSLNGKSGSGSRANPKRGACIRAGTPGYGERGVVSGAAQVAVHPPPLSCIPKKASLPPPGDAAARSPAGGPGYRSLRPARGRVQRSRLVIPVLSGTTT